MKNTSSKKTENAGIQTTLEVVDGHTGRTVMNEAETSKLKEYAVEALTAAEHAVTAYLKLCTYVRTLDLPPANVRPVLLEAGYVKTRVAEIIRVSYAPAEVWGEYTQQAIGFKMALGKAREANQKPKSEKLKAERIRFAEKLRALVEEFVPVAGKLPGFFPVEITAQGCEVVLTCRREKKTKPAKPMAAHAEMSVVGG